jgi:mannosyltransferase
MLAAALRFPTLAGQSYWSDEAATVSLVGKGFSGMLGAIPHTESTPPLYYLVAWPWSRLFGSDEAGLRSLSALAGTATVAIAYAAARQLGGRLAASAAAALVAVNPLLVWYSQEARSYALLSALSSLSFLLFVRLIRRPDGRDVAAWTLVSALAIATHYFAAFVVAPEAAWLLARWRSPRVSFAVGTVALAAIAVVPLAVEQRGTGNPEWIAEGPLGRRLVNVGKAFLVGRDAPRDKLLAAVVAVALVIAVSVVARRNRQAFALLVPAGVVGVAALAVPAALAVAGLDYLNAQNAIGALVPLAVAAGIAISAARPRTLGILALTVVCATSISLVAAVARNRVYQRGDWRAAAKAIDRTRAERIVVAGPDYGGSFARLPLGIYLPDSHPIDRGDVQRTMQYRYLAASPRDGDATRAFRIREIVVVTLGVPARVRLPHEFRLVELRRDPVFELRRYRSDRPVSVSAHALVAHGPKGTGTAVLLEEPPSQRP